MPERRIALTAVLSSVNGRWYRGSARVVDVDMGPLSLEIPDLPNEVVRVVEFDDLEEYLLSRSGAAAALELCDIAEDSSEDKIVRFARRHGPLLDVVPWALEIEPKGSPQNPRERTAIWTEPEVRHDPSDMLDFRRWCHRNGEARAARYIPWACRQLQADWNSRSQEEHKTLAMPPRRRGTPQPLWAADRFVVPEPVALYMWAAARMAALRYELAHGCLSAESERWLGARLGETHLQFDAKKGWLRIRAKTQLSYVAAQMLLDKALQQPLRRLCPNCGNWFSATRANQQYCSLTCKETFNKRNYRKRQRAHQTVEEDQNGTR